MGAVHDLIEARGRQAALNEAENRQVVEATLQFMADDDPEAAFVYSGWAQSALPHRRLPDERDWVLETDHVTLLVEAGKRVVNGVPIPIGVPFGSRARLILIYLQTEALRTGSREVELGGSLREWISRMGISIGGKTTKEIREQAERIARCRMSFHVTRGSKSGLVNQSIVDSAMFVEDAGEAGQGSLFAEVAKLSEGFYEQLKKHPVPVQEAAIRALSNNSMAHDAYVWLAYRLHSLQAPKTISWKALHAQMGAGFSQQKHFKPKFRENLALALAVYPDARVDDDDRGLTLHPSRPPVAPRLIGGSSARR